MKNLWKLISLLFLAAHAMNASALNKCTDANGQVTYTNTDCQYGDEASPIGNDASIAGDSNPTFSQQELDQMLAPIALYEDSLLSQILVASTYPLEIVEAARWSRNNPQLSGDTAVQTVSDQPWDPSIKSLVAFPQVLNTLDQNIEWTERMGDAFLSQQVQVMDTIQTLRKKAQAAGNLNSNSQIQVAQSEDNIVVTSANPAVVYVPYYNPMAIYGLWWWPNYPPMYWSPWAGYGWHNGLAWGNGVGIGGNVFYGSFGWRARRIIDRPPLGTGNGQTWQHDPAHRHGVPYRDASLNRQFGQTTATNMPRAEFRGYEQSVNMRSGVSANRPQSAPPPARQQNVAANMGHIQSVEPRPHALEYVGQGAAVRNFSARGRASFRGRSSAQAGRGGR